MKFYLKRICFLIGIIVVISSLITHFPKDIPPHQDQKLDKINLISPIRILIPSLAVDTSVQKVGVNSDGVMENPSNAVDVGWFYPGPRPGEKGSAVIAGHIDAGQGETGVFAKLHELKKGDRIYVKNSDGSSVEFIVRKIHSYDPGYAEEVFSKNDGTYLNLITCDGIWDDTKKSYTKRLVVFANAAI